MAKRDYYDILGVPRTATQDEIRRAYRKLARELHPDVNKAKDAQARFTEVQEAYDVLSDEEKRKRFDRYGSAEPATAAGAAGPGRAHYSWSNVAGNQPGDFDFDLDAESLGSMFDAFFGGRGGVGAGGARAARGPKARAETRPAPAHAEVTIEFMTAAKGGTQRLRVSGEAGARTLEVRIPKGTSDGTRLRVRGGADGRDVILTVRVGAHPLFRREGVGAASLDVNLEVPLTIAEATLGATITVPTVQGRAEIVIPAGTASGQRLRLRGQGIEDESGRKGDLYAAVKIVAPDGRKLSPVQRTQLEEISGFAANPRGGPEWSGAT